MESGALLAREYFDPSRIPTLALPDCSPTSARTSSVRSVFWHSEMEPVPESIRAVVARCQARACAQRGGFHPLVVVRGEDVYALAPQKDAPLPENRGATGSGGEVTASGQLGACSTRKGQGQSSSQRGRTRDDRG